MSVWLLDCLSPEQVLLRFLLLWLLVPSSACHSTGSATATTIKSQSSSSLPIPLFMQGYGLRLDGLDEGEFTEGHELDRRWRVRPHPHGRLRCGFS